MLFYLGHYIIYSILCESEIKCKKFFKSVGFEQQVSRHFTRAHENSYMCSVELQL